MRFTVRELLLVTAFLAASCAALKYANSTWWILLLSLSFLAATVGGVVAIAERGLRQIVAASFVFAFVAYAILAFAGPDRDSLPTTALLNRLFPLMTTSKWVDVRTRQVVRDYDPQNPSRFVQQTFEHSEYKFRDIGHVLFAVMFGYLAARLGAWIYFRRRAREQTEGGGNIAE